VRLQGMANPNAIVIAESTRQLVGNLFDLEDLGPKDIKGISGVRAWAVLRGASAFESRFEALHATGLTALVGRDEECELLLRRWSKAKTGEGQVALLSGEAGIGKSRLTAALMERVAGEPHTRLRYFCSPQHDRISTESRVRFRIGVHLGEVMVRDTDIYGDGVNVAARLQALAEPGGICVSDRIQRRRASSTVFLKT
jgi:class 3 adenylate cyclase